MNQNMIEYPGSDYRDILLGISFQRMKGYKL